MWTVVKKVNTLSLRGHGLAITMRCTSDDSEDTFAVGTRECMLLVPQWVSTSLIEMLTIVSSAC